MKAVFSPLAEKQLKKLPKIVQISVARKVRNINDEVVAANMKYLSGYKGLYRIRVGDYRLVFRKYTNKAYFILIGHRKEIYLLLKKLWN